jgi:hypothetical protein
MPLAPPVTMAIRPRTENRSEDFMYFLFLPHPEERPQGASRRMGHNVNVAMVRDAVLAHGSSP